MLIFLQLEALWRLHLRQRWSYRVAWILGGVGMLVELGIVLFLGRLIDSAGGSRFSPNEYFGFAAVGVSFTGLVTGMTGSAAGWIREGQLTGTLEAVMLSPAPHGRLVLLAGLVAVPGLLVRLVLGLIGAWLLGAEFDVQLGKVGLLFLLCGFLIVPVSLLASALVILIKRGDIVTYAVSTASLLLSGVYFPRDVLPIQLQWLAWSVPTTHVLDFARDALLPAADAPSQLVGLLGYLLCIWPAAVCALVFALKFGKIRGNLGQY